MMNVEFTEKEIQEFRTVLKSGLGGPPDMYKGFSDFGVLNKVHLGYLKDGVKEYAEFYNHQLLVNSEKQVTIFDNKNKALEKLKELVSSDILVIIMGHHGNHYMVVTGYDENYIYFNDPGFDGPFVYEDYSQQEYEEKSKMPIELFVNQWTISGFEGGGIDFPGNYGMSWFGEEVTDSEGGRACKNFDNKQEECLLHEECKWIPEKNICNLAN